MTHANMNKMMRSKRAQITVFMIVGIILLFSSALLFYIRNQITGGIPEDFIPVAEEVPLEAQPIKVFVEDCMKKVATEGIVKMGAHGGYIDPRDSAYGRTFAVGIDPTDSDALSMIEGTSALIPYWWYLESPNECSDDCAFASNRPALYKRQGGESSVEGQLDTYIKRNLPACIEGFASFREQGFQIEVLGALEPDFKVAEKESLVILKYPLKISREGRTIDIENFFTKVDVDLKQVYDLATDIVNSELEIHFLEAHALNLIGMYSKPVGIDRLPPIGYYSFFNYGEYLIWTTTETRQRIESYVLPAGMSMLQIADTSNSQRHVMFDVEKKRYDRIMTGIMDKTLVTLNSSIAYPQLEARLVYLDWWPIYLNINDAEILKPVEVSSVFAGPLLDLLGSKQYRFTYDLSYPVLVTVSDPLAFNGEGFKFSFALESNIRGNTFMNSSFSRLPRQPASSYFCDIHQRNSGPIRVEVEDLFSGAPVPHARVDFIAGDELCFVGFAELDENNRSVLATNFPIGFGEIRVMGEKYIPLKQPFSTNLDEAGNYTFRMMPMYAINATVSPVPLTYQGNGKYVLPPGVPVSSLSPLKNKVVMSLTRINDDGFGEYDAYLVYNLSEGPSEMMIVPGKYEVEGYLLLYEKRTVPRQEKTFEVMFSDDVTIVMNESVFFPWSEGGVVFNNVTGFLEIREEDLFGSSMVRFKILRFPPAITHSAEMGPGPDLEQLGQYEMYSNIYKHELQPEWVR